MMPDKLSSFREIWLISFEFDRPDGESPVPTRLRARELRSGRTTEMGRDQLLSGGQPPASGDLIVVPDSETVVLSSRDEYIERRTSRRPHLDSRSVRGLR